MPLGHSFDRYVIQARILPVLLTVFPLASLVAVWLPDESAIRGGLGKLSCFSPGAACRLSASCAIGIPISRGLRWNACMLPWEQPWG